MELSIKNYRNIKELTLSIEENKVNFIYGISGSGKTTIAKAFIGVINDENVSYGKSIDEVKIKLTPELDEKDFSIFNEETYRKLLIDRTDNPNIYSIAFSNEDELDVIREKITCIVSRINSKRQILYEYVSNVEEMIKRINKRKFGKNEVFSSSSLIEKIKKETENPSYGEYSRFIHKNGLDYVKWIELGSNFPLFEKGKCPFCERKFTDYRKNKIDNILRIKPDQYEIIAESQDVLSNIKIEVPNFSSKREINKLDKKLNDAIKNKNSIISLYNMIDSYSYNTLDLNTISKVNLPNGIIELFPDINEIVCELNRNINELRKQYSIIKSKTKKIVEKNLKELNEYLYLLAIPYKFNIDSYDTIHKTANVLLISTKDNKKKDRTDNLSFGEKNLISLLLFLLSNDKKISIIDDPASSYDENRRKVIYEFIYKFKKSSTFIVLSHDQVFIKYAILGITGNRNKSYVDNTGKVVCLENILDTCIVNDIIPSDFGSIRSQVIDFIKKNKLSYYRKIINLRILSECDRNNGKKHKIIYSYLSAILHSTSRDEIKLLLSNNNLVEKDVIKYIKDIYNINLERIPNDIMNGFDYDELTLFEKIAFKREEERIRRERSRRAKSYLEKEYDDIIHLNTRYFISLNPYKYNIFSEQVYKSL